STVTPPNANNFGASASASPTTTPVNRFGAKNSNAASATCSVVTWASRAGCSLSHSAPSPSSARADSWFANPDWDDEAINNVPIAYWRTESTSASVGGTNPSRPSSYRVSSSAAAVTSLAVSASTCTVAFDPTNSNPEWAP